MSLSLTVLPSTTSASIKEGGACSDSLIRVTPSISISRRELYEEFVRASGPGGQNVNKVSTAVQLRFNVFSSRSLPAEVKERLVRLAGKRLCEDGTLLIKAQRFRTQDRNRQDALDQLTRLIQLAAERPKLRRATRPTLASKQRRLESKQRTGATKRLRQPVSHFTD